MTNLFHQICQQSLYTDFLQNIFLTSCDSDIVLGNDSDILPTIVILYLENKLCLTFLLKH